MRDLREEWEDAVKEAKKSEFDLSIEWVNDNDGSYKQALHDHNCLVQRANRLYLALQLKEQLQEGEE
tara:strand:+ start:146 stop:346 length:201 start_codon:yes stop_codon:yes gene_type:complete